MAPGTRSRRKRGQGDHSASEGSRAADSEIEDKRPKKRTKGFEKKRTNHEKDTSESESGSGESSSDTEEEGDGDIAVSGTSTETIPGGGNEVHHCQTRVLELLATPSGSRSETDSTCQAKLVFTPIPSDRARAAVCVVKTLYANQGSCALEQPPNSSFCRVQKPRSLLPT